MLCDSDSLLSCFSYISVLKHVLFHPVPCSLSPSGFRVSPKASSSVPLYFFCLGISTRARHSDIAQKYNTHRGFTEPPGRGSYWINATPAQSLSGLTLRSILHSSWIPSGSEFKFPSVAARLIMPIFGGFLPSLKLCYLNCPSKAHFPNKLSHPSPCVRLLSLLEHSP